MQRSPFRIPRLPLLLSLLLVGLAGCGRGGPALAPVTGTVTYNGTPLAKGRICFRPATGRPAYGDIVDGKIINVTTLTTGDGATIGPNQVGINSVEEAVDMYTPGKSLIPHRYADPQKSGLTAQIKAGQVNDVKFELTDK